MAVVSNFWIDFRRFFLRGLAAVLPTLLTLMIVIYVFNFVNDKIGVRINAGILYVLDKVHVAPAPPAPLPSDWKLRPGEKGYNLALWQVWWNQRWYLRGVGFVVAIILVYFIGRFVASFVGRTVWQIVERGLMRTPVLKQIYPNIKQVTDFFFSQKATEFSRVVAVEYPRRGVWSLGLVTGQAMRTLRDELRSDLLTVFVPSSPTPVTGYTVTVRRDEILDLPLTIDEALRFVVSGGVVLPPGEDLAAAPRQALPARPAPADRPGHRLPQGDKDD